jgi:hypothetical protein
MKAKFYKLLILALICSVPVLKAQVTNTGNDAFGYTFATNLAASNPAVYEWIDISSTGTRVTGLGDDNIVGPYPLGIDFKYYWNTYNSVFVGSNGYIMFGESALIAQGSSGMPTIPVSTDGKGNFIAPMLADLTFVSSADGSPLAGAKILYQTVGNKFVITYDSVRFWNGGASGDPVTETSGLNTFQVVLDGTTNNIQVNYKSCVGPAFSGSTGVVSMGMENITGQLGLRWRRLTSTTILTLGLPAPNSSTVVRYPASSTYLFRDVAAKGVFFRDNKGGMAFSSVPKTIEAYVKNAGTVKISTPCSARVLISDYNDNAIYNRTVVIDSLQQGEEKLVVFPVPLEPGDSAGGYKVRLSTTLTGDQYANNNIANTKLIVLDSTQGEFNLKYTRPNPGTVADSRQAPGGMILDAPYLPMVVSHVTADLIWPDPDGWATLLPGVTTNDSLTKTRIEVYLGDGPGGSRGSLIDSFTIAAETDWNAQVIGEEVSNGTMLNKIIRFKHPLPVPFWWETNQRIFIGAIHNRTTRFIWNAPYAEVYPVGTPASGRALEITAGVWGEDRGKDSLDIALGLIGNPVVPATMSLSLSNNQVCAGETLAIPFSISGGPFQADNQFKLELSQSSGSFINATVLATQPGQASGVFNFTLPAGLSPGIGYRIRVVSTNPVYSGTTAGILIGPAATPSGINGPFRVCPSENGVVFSAAGAPNGTAFNWTLPEGASFASADSTREITVNFGANATGNITASARNKCGVSSPATRTISPQTVTISTSASTLTALSSGAVSFVWFLDNNPISGATGSSTPITGNGLYCVEATFPSGCKVLSPCVVITSSAAEISSSDGLSIFPNPSYDQLNVHLISTGEFSGETSVRNMMGQEFARFQSAGLKTINVGSWPAGVYVVTAAMKSGKTIRKFVQIGAK